MSSRAPGGGQLGAGTGGDLASQHLDTYVKDRENYDKFFSEILSNIERLDQKEIMDTYLLSSIKNTQLRNAFRQEEDNKKQLMREKQVL